MSLFILDTDTISFIQQNHPHVLNAVTSARNVRHQLAITAITVEEQATGWFAEFRTARTHTRLAQLSSFFAQAIELWGSFQVLPQTEASLARFEALVAAKLNVGKMDLRIASIAIEVGGIVVTHNLRDFRRIPGVATLDWTVAPSPPTTP